MVDEEKIRQIGVEAAEALRAAAEVLTDESIPLQRRIEAYRRCIGRHATLSGRLLQQGNRYIMETSLAAHRAAAGRPDDEADAGSLLRSPQ